LPSVADEEDHAMTIITVNFRPAAVSARSSLLQRAWSAVRQAHAVSRTRHVLSALDDRMLSDIGASRADAEPVAAVWDAGLR